MNSIREIFGICRNQRERRIIKKSLMRGAKTMNRMKIVQGKVVNDNLQGHQRGTYMTMHSN